MSAKAKREAKRRQKPLTTPIGRAITDSDVLEAFRVNWPLGMTRRELAEYVGRQVTPTLIKRIEKFVDAGYLTRDIEKWPNGVRGYKYTWISHPDEINDMAQRVFDEYLAGREDQS